MSTAEDVAREARELLELLAESEPLIVLGLDNAEQQDFAGDLAERIDALRDALLRHEILGRVGT